ncbi:FadR family transcriptional regulator [Pelagovum pacificum]|uniref:FadR family transcriptional regulator n=2 Tax=Pelagovum pacificum TaxID=2588711 RepID=A0A5C5GCK5_9RHOB|nr:FadR family transcriptional regulator [Pelagovum pacificum]TNY31702.1 FadR family transcriptional regulator [Pelagovum pacificum]
MESPTGTRSTLADRIFHILHTRISSGEYQENQRLPSEKELSEQFSVSRPIIRFALSRLRDENLIYSRQGAGSFVRAPAQEARLGFAPLETIADIQRCYEFRLAIEPVAARHAAERHNPSALERIEASLQMMADATRRHSHREDADFVFHQTISEASNNHYFSSSMLALKSHIGVGMKLHGEALMGPQPGLQAVFDEHYAIFEAIRDGQGDLAHDLMTEHLHGSRDRLFEGGKLDLRMR